MTTTTIRKTTDEQILNVKHGDVVLHYCNGIIARHKVDEVKWTGHCINERSGAFGCAYAYVSCFMRDEASTTRMGFSIESDAYSIGRGYPTHDCNGNRIGGFEIVTAE